MQCSTLLFLGWVTAWVGTDLLLTCLGSEADDTVSPCQCTHVFLENPPR